jgi:hypothetical protein
MQADPALRSTPIVLVTGLLTKKEAAARQVFGGFHALAKPVHGSKLIACAIGILDAQRTAAAWIPHAREC